MATIVTPYIGSLKDCEVREVPRAEAQPIIEQYEWLGSAGNAHRFWALYTPSGEVQAVVGITESFHNAGDGCAVLARGCTTPVAHRNAATRLIGAVSRVLKAEGFRALVAYSDALAGERGTVYRAAGMLPVKGSHGPARQRVRPPGVKWHEHHKCHSDRWLRNGGRNWSVAAARRRGYRVERVPARVRWERWF